MDYTKDVKIDETALDVEWLNQPALAIKYGVYYAECFKRFQQAEENIKVVRAELIKKAWNNPEKCLGKGIKPAAQPIEAYYRTHEEHIEAKNEWIKAQYELNVADVAKWQISNARKEALENLVKLHGQNYFAGPSMPRNLSNEVERKQQQTKVDSGIAAKFQRNKK